MSEHKLREALERLTAETDNPVSREIGRAALAIEPEHTNGAPDCGITGCLLPQGHDGEHLDPPCFATDLDALCKCGKPKRDHIGKPLGMDGHWFEAALAEPRQAEEFDARTAFSAWWDKWLTEHQKPIEWPDDETVFVAGWDAGRAALRAESEK